VANPLCVPSRASIFSSRTPHTLAIYGNTMDAELHKKGVPTMGELFQAAVYETAYAGKWHVHAAWSGGEHDPLGMPKSDHGGDTLMGACLGRGCDSLRPPAEFRLRRFLRRRLVGMMLFPKKKAVVTNPTRGVLAFFAGGRTKPQDDASRSAAWSFHRDAILSVRNPAASCEQRLRRFLPRFLRRLQKRTLEGFRPD
jgi:hypothetical protein